MASEIESIRRSRAREVEHRAWIEATRPEREARQTGDGRKVTWGEATLEDHRKRVELLARGLKGNIQTIRLHEYAAEILRETGATCLNRSKAISFA